MKRKTDIQGVLNGSRFIEQPHIVPEVNALKAFIEGPQPVLVDVGFDHGRRLHATARENPDWRVVGLEVRKHRVEEAIARAKRDDINNVHPWRMDARTVFGAVFEPNCVDVVDILFPTPWWNPALRRKRLLVDVQFLENVMQSLRPSGHLSIATDVADYAARINSAIDALGLQVSSFDAVKSRRPTCSQKSRREWKCERENIPVHRWYLESPS